MTRPPAGFAGLVWSCRQLQMGVGVMRAMAAGGALVLMVGVVVPAVVPGVDVVAAAPSSAVLPFDFDGDGYADLAVSAPGEDRGGIRDAGAVHVLYGSASGPTARDQVWHQNRKGVQGSAERDDLFGEALASGDFDADGYADLGVGVPHEDVGSAPSAGVVQVLYGSARGLTARDQLWRLGKGGVPGSPDRAPWFGSALGAGDFDGDGYADLAIGVPNAVLAEFAGSPGSIAVSGEVIVLRGGPAGLTASGIQTFSLMTPGMAHAPVDSLFGRHFGARLAVGDVNADGRADLAVVAPSESGDKVPGAVHVLLGSAAGLGIDGNQYLSASAMGFTNANGVLGPIVSGDINGDGRDDLVVGDDAFEPQVRDGLLAVMYAGANGFVAADAQHWSFDRTFCPDGDLERRDALAVGDLTGDGFADLAVGAAGYICGEIAQLGGAVGVLVGSANGLVEHWTVVTQDTPGIPGTAEPEDAFGTSVAILPLAGATRAWLAVGDPMEDLGSRRDAGRVVVIPGAPSGLGASSARAWHQDSAGIKGAAETGDEFGRVVGPDRAVGAYGH